MPEPVELPSSRTVPKKERRPSLVWIVPIVAALAGAWVAVTRILAEGPTITIGFRSAEGLEAGKTKVRYNGVDVGTMTAIRLSDDHRGVVATVRMEPKTERLLVTDTRFWVVRPRISGATVSGLGTLVSGAYVRMDIGQARDRQRAFVGLETPPVVMRDVPGRQFVLKASDLGSLESGTPIFYRRLHVGEITSYELDPDGASLTVKAFVLAPYDRYVTSATRFWHASGLDVSMSASGFSVQTQSLMSILIGGIAFETPGGEAALSPAEENASFLLHRDRAEAFRAPERNPLEVRLVFKQSVRGLAPGAPVEFRGIQVGQVVEVGAEVDAKTLEISVPVKIHLEGARYGVRFTDVDPSEDPDAIRRRLWDSLIAHGVRAQLRSGSLLTGALFVAFDVFPDAAPAGIDWAAEPLEFPTVPGALEGLEASLASIVRKLDQLPLKAIGDDVTKVLVQLNQTLASARGALDDAGELVAPSSPLATELSTTLQEVTRAARAIRVLGDYLERHPEALLRGKSGEAP
ncbi:MAG: MCE family protein [Deltaproteobacteria bacterium]|nr:MCE family protein [Deltaproteobacteria bacterium]